MSISNKNILITGGFGFIGSFIVKKLVENNKITILDSQKPDNSPLAMQGVLNHPHLSFKICEIENFENFKDIGINYDYIIHLAAILGVAKVIAYPMQTMNVNGIGTMNILKLALSQTNLKRFMFFSTSEIYGQNCESVNENGSAHVPLEGIRWNYSCSKIFGEYLVKSAAQEHGLPYVIIRPFNVYGPYRTGENAMSAIITKALLNEEVLISGDGSQIRAWCHIKDFTDGVIKALESSYAVNQAFNLGNDQEVISMQNLANTIIHTLNSNSSVTILDNHIEDIKNRSPNIEKAKSILGYCPEITIQQGIVSIANWLTEQLYTRNLKTVS